MLSPMELRVRALESTFMEKGNVDPAALNAMIETYETSVDPEALLRNWQDLRSVP